MEVLKAIQVRHGVSAPVVEQYTDSLKDKTNELPPIIIFKIVDDKDELNGHMVIADGIHRYNAYKAAGRKKIPYVLKEGTRTEAILCGISENLKHGQLFNRNDKRHALSLLLEDPRYADASVRELATVLHISHGTAHELRREGCRAGKPRTRA